MGLGDNNNNNKKESKKPKKKINKAENVNVSKKVPKRVKQPIKKGDYKIKKSSNKKPKADNRPFYKKKWFVGILVLIISAIIYLIGVNWPLNESNNTEQANDIEQNQSEPLSDVEERARLNDVPVEHIDATDTAEQHLLHNVHSKNSLFEQLIDDGYHSKSASYAVDNVDVDWLDQATMASEEYIVLSAPEFTEQGLRDYLAEEGFTEEQIDEVANNIGDIHVDE